MDGFTTGTCGHDNRVPQDGLGCSSVVFSDVQSVVLFWKTSQPRAAIRSNFSEIRVASFFSTLTRFDPRPFLLIFDRYSHHLLHPLDPTPPQRRLDSTTDFIPQFRNLDDLEFHSVPKHASQSQRHQTSLGPCPRFAPRKGTLRIVNTVHEGPTHQRPFPPPGWPSLPLAPVRML